MLIAAVELAPLLSVTFTVIGWLPGVVNVALAVMPTASP
jgi:hypothetical protein